MKKIQYLLFVMAMMLAMPKGSAQAQLTEQQKQELQERVKQKVEEFESSLSKIVDNSYSHEVRKGHVKLLLNLFVGAGEPYTYYDFGLMSDVESTGVRMQTSSKYSEKKNWQKLKKYIYKLYNPTTGKSEMMYKKIEITFAEHVRVDNIYRVGDHYEAIAYFTQRFVGTRADGSQYSDTTTKKIRCYIYSEVIDGETVMMVLLGDIYVLLTK